MTSTCILVQCPSSVTQKDIGDIRWYFEDPRIGGRLVPNGISFLEDGCFVLNFSDDAACEKILASAQHCVNIAGEVVEMTVSRCPPGFASAFTRSDPIVKLEKNYDCDITKSLYGNTSRPSPISRIDIIPDCFDSAPAGSPISNFTEQDKFEDLEMEGSSVALMETDEGLCSTSSSSKIRRLSINNDDDGCERVAKKPKCEKTEMSEDDNDEKNFTGSAAADDFCASPSSSDTRERMIQVLDVPSDVTEILELYLESEKTGGGDVESFSHDTENHVCVVTFVERSVAERFRSQGSISVEGHMLPISQLPEAEVRVKEERMDMVETIEPVPVTVIEVTGIKPKLSEDVLRLYFENRKRSGGGPIEDIQIFLDEERAIITFKDSEVAKNVLERGQHSALGFPLQCEALDKGLHDVPLRAIEVQGFDTNISEEMLLLFFENRKRSGGGPVEEMYYRPDEHRAVITFKCPEVVERILKNHRSMPLVLNDVRLTIMLLRPAANQSCYAGDVELDMLLILNIPSDSSSDDLILYLQRGSRNAVVRLRYSMQPGTAMAYFESTYDYGYMRELVCTRPFHGAMLSIQKVPVSYSIQVFNFGHLTYDHLVLYFENHKSGGDEVSDGYINTDEGYAVLTFTNTNVIANILTRKHEIEGQELKVAIYYKGLGVMPPDVDDEKPAWWLPMDFAFSFDGKKLDFIASHPRLQQDIEKELETVHCRIEWPLLTSECDLGVPQDGMLSCLLTRNVANYGQLAKSWASVAKERMSQELCKILCAEFSVLQELWEAVGKRLKSLKDDVPDDGDVQVSVDSDDCVIRIVGFGRACEQFLESLKKILHDAEEELQREKRKISEQIQKLKCHQFELLKLIGFLDSSSTDGVDVSVKGMDILFYGQPSDIQTKKVKMYEILSSILSELIDIPDFVLESLRLVPFRNHVCTCLREKSVVSCWDIGPKGLTVYALQQSEVDRTSQIMKTEIIQYSKDLDPREAATLTLPSWNTLKTSFISKIGAVVVKESASVLSVTTVNSHVNVVVEEIQKFIKENAIEEEFLITKPGTAVVMSRYMSTELIGVCRDFQSCRVSVKKGFKDENTGFLVSGTKFGIDHAVQKIIELSKRVIEVEKVIDRPGMSNFFHSGRGKKQIEGIESRHQVCIEEWEAANRSAISSFASRRGRTPSAVDSKKPIVLCQMNLGNAFVVKVVHGDITEYRVDAIVNAANCQLDHHGGVARVIVDKGGQEIQFECKAYIRTHRSLLPGNFFVSKPGSLPCQFIIHAVGPIWEDGKKNEENVLFDTIYNVLEEAERLKLQNVAMPAISTGVFGFPMRKAAKITLEAVTDFVKSRAKDIKFLREVHLIDNNKRATDEFADMLTRLGGSPTKEREMASSYLDQPIIIEDDSEPSTSSNASWSHDIVDLDPSGGALSPSRVVPLQPKSGASSSASFSIQSPKSSVSSNILTTPEGLTVTLVKGSLVQQAVDIIVNTTAQTLVLSNGAVSNLILQMAGPQIQLECQRKAPGGLGVGQIVVTPGYSLPCSYVFHGYCINWDNGAGPCEQSVRGLLKSVFSEAHKVSMSSIAIPAIGTGNLRIPPDVVARIMYEEAEEFSRLNVGTALIDIRFVVYDRDLPTVNAFETELRFPTRGQKQPKGRKPTERILAKNRSMSTDTPKSNDGFSGWSIKINEVTLEVVEGDITTATTDAIVNSTNENMNLRLGSVSYAILQAGGQTIQDECNRIGKMIDGLAVTSAGKLPSRMIFHLKAHSTERSWRKGIESCLVGAEQRKVNSMTFPLLGTGNIKAPVEMMASVMLDSVVNFCMKSNPQHLSLIRIAIFQLPMVKEFAKAINKKASELQSNGYFSRLKVYVKSFLGMSNEPPKPSFEVKEIPTDKVRKFEERVRFNIYGLSEKSIDASVSELEDLCSEVVEDKIIEKDKIAKLSDEQIEKIKGLELEHAVKITIERGHRLNRIRIQGEGRAIVAVHDKIYAIFNEIEEDEREQYHADVIAQQAQWMYHCDGSYDPYPKPINFIIETKYQKQLPFAEWEEDDGSYRLDFQRMEETKNGDAKNVVKVKRMTSESLIPKSWDTMNANELCRRVPLVPSSPEYQDVLRNVSASSGVTMQQIVAIERIQNPSLYQQYVVRREAMERLLQGSNVQCERILWHGTSADTLDSINHHGFNRSYCGKNAVAYGKGVYFALNFSYSGSNTYAVPDSNGNKHVYQSRVLTGEYVVGNQSYFVAPAKPGSTAARYDSVVDNPALPAIFVVFSDTQAYPEYLIIFK